MHAIVLAGGSAFGLDAATGTMRYLEERGIGARFGGHTIPIVPAAILFDLPVGDGKIRPDANCGYLAAKNATTDAVAEGNVGAGAGATIGKLAGRERAMKAGIGSAEVQLRDGIIVAAIVAVNAVGDIVDPATGKVIAGMRTEDGKGLADVRTLLRSRPALRQPQAGDLPAMNTTLGIVATNATLTKTQATRVAQIAHDGFARAIVPVHTGERRGRDLRACDRQRRRDRGCRSRRMGRCRGHRASDRPRGACRDLDPRLPRRPRSAPIASVGHSLPAAPLLSPPNRARAVDRAPGATR